MKDTIGQLLSCIVVQGLISEVAMLRGVELASPLWFLLVIGGGIIFNVGLGMRK
jgi:hypothetical protein